MTSSQLVVDGSNIATEGRTAPSLAELDQAVRDFLKEHAFDNVVVVVDASFPNRIDPSERDAYEEAVLAGELLTPPAGAVGRGDAFVLQIAERSGATVLSNDSFQEFHATYEWLFSDGRLWGGKPVPGVGWVFVARVPVRGPVSRRATRDAKKAPAKKAAPAAPARKAPAKKAPAAASSSGSKATKAPARRSKKAAPAAADTRPAPTEGAAGGRGRRKSSEPINSPGDFLALRDQPSPGHRGRRDGHRLLLARRVRRRRGRSLLHRTQVHGRPRPPQCPRGAVGG